MKYERDIETDLESLDDDIVWNQKRQQHVRKRVISRMKREKGARFSWMKRRFIPAFSLLLLVTVATTIFLSEFSGNEVANEGNNIAYDRGNGDNSTHLIADDNSDNDGNTNNNEENIEENDNDMSDWEGADNADENDAAGSTPTNDEQSSSYQSERTLTQAEVIHAVKGQMSTDLEITLPNALPIEDGTHLTAVTDSKAHAYEVIFYQHDTPIPINNQLLFSDENPAEVVARLTVEQYDTREEADEVIGYEEFDEQTGNEINLSHTLKGYQDAGAGSMWTSWNVGRWALATHASTENADKSESLAKEIVTYLQENMLPIPEPNGFAHLDSENNDNRIVWEKGTTVYTIDQVNDPIKALDIAVDFE